MAIANIRKRKLRSWLTMIGILIGILTIVSLIALGEGLRIAIIGQFGGFAPDLISISTGAGGGPPGTGVTVPFTQDDVDRISSLKEIDTAAGRSIGFGKSEFNNRVTFMAATSIPDGDGRDLISYAMNMKAETGRMLRDGETGSVVVGHDFAGKDTFGKEIKIGSKIKVNDKEFYVVGILKKQGSFMIDGIVMMNDNDYDQTFNRNKKEYSFIGARYKSKMYSVEDASLAIEKLLRRQRNVKEGSEDFTVSTPQSTIDTLNSTLFAVQLFVYIIAGISIVVGGIGIMTTMYTTILERTREIGIMKAIGARNSTIFILFFIESGFIGLIGGLIGVILGVGVAYGLAAIGQAVIGEGLIQAKVSSWLIFGSLAFSFLLGSLFGTFPALQAAKMKPVDALSRI
jgi:putative ABC transport system permease protein